MRRDDEEDPVADAFEALHGIADALLDLALPLEDGVLASSRPLCPPA